MVTGGDTPMGPQGIPDDLPADPGASMRPESTTESITDANPQLRATMIMGADLGPDFETTQAQPSAYLLRREVGRGAFGEVWEAVQVALKRVVAVKRPRTPDGDTDSERLEQSRVAELLFKKEAL